MQATNPTVQPSAVALPQSLRKSAAVAAGIMSNEKASSTPAMGTISTVITPCVAKKRKSQNASRVVPTPRVSAMIRCRYT